ncbi:hypothetical protein HYQ46_006230 [Verticillium longisporum]|nr:hypothetical protein HYQ46_006230 [Verticillium longisporum]
MAAAKECATAPIASLASFCLGAGYYWPTRDPRPPFLASSETGCSRQGPQLPAYRPVAHPACSRKCRRARRAILVPS